MKTFCASMVVAGIVAIAVQPAAAQRSIRVKCQAAIRAQPKVCIDIPREGVTVSGSTLRVVLKASGVDIAAVTQGKEGAAHYHLFLDVPGPADGEAIPQGPGVTHLGDGAREVLLSNLSPGLHRLIAVLGDNSHVPIARAQRDTTYFSIAVP